MSGDSCFANVVVQTAVHMLPSRLSSIRDGVQHYLNGLLMKYVEAIHLWQFYNRFVFPLLSYSLVYIILMNLPPCMYT